MTSAAGRVGAGLAPARDARPIRPGERIHVVGAAGAGASAGALLAARSGAAVTGCDAGGPSPYTEALDAAGVPLVTGHSADHVTTPPPPERLAVTKALTAVDPDHPELAAARERGIPVEPWQQLVADAAVGRRLVGVGQCRLDPRRFVRIHRSAIVNVDRVREIRHHGREMAVVLHDGCELKVARSHRDKLHSLR